MYYLTGDGVHFGPAATKAWTSLGGCTIVDAQGRMNQPCWINVEVTAPMFSNFPGTFQAFKLLQLFPGWQVCGVQSAVATAFTGSGWTAASVSVGNSQGTPTDYLGAQSLLTTGTSKAGPSSLAGSPGAVTA